MQRPPPRWLSKIPVADFVEQIPKLSNYNFVDQFQEITRSIRRRTRNLLTDGVEGNESCVRVGSVLPFNSTRVHLSSHPFHSFINASWVNLPTVQREFIACPGPMPSTVEDFWRMVHEQRVQLIVMLTLSDDDSSAQYWPDFVNWRQKFGDFEVTLLKSRLHGAFVKRRLRLRAIKGRGERLVTQLQYLNWPKNSVPDEMEFGRFCRAYRRLVKPLMPLLPIVVHCRDGSGCTGVFVTINAILHTVLDIGEDTVDVGEVIEYLNTCRGHMVHNAMQLQFVCHFLSKNLCDRKPTVA